MTLHAKNSACATPADAGVAGSCNVLAHLAPVAAGVMAIALFFAAMPAAEVRAQTTEPTPEGKAISPDLFGIFFEDINYAADGGLYAELVQNRSFEYQATEQKSWNPLSFWEVKTYGDGRGSLNIDAGRPVDANNPHYAVLDVSRAGDGVGIVNGGFDGIVVREGETYDVSAWVRQLYVEKRWGGEPIGPNNAFSVHARLETKDGASLGETQVPMFFLGSEWHRISGEIVAKESDDNARLVVFTKMQGGVALDEVSLFPRKTFHDRPNGMRADLAETIAAMKPKFVRFPGGCLVHGNGLSNMYRWKDTIGPVEQRRQQANLWGYHQTVGLGYFEYFQFCEDIGAKPLPVVPAGVCCQNAGHTSGVGQDGMELELIPDYIQEVLDLIEWANGPATSTSGAKRAAAGHPEPFHLEYLAIGNEEAITPVFEERFKLIYEAVRKKHPEITIIGTVGPFPDGEDFEKGWRIADELHVPMVDEHYYKSPAWFRENMKRYDGYDRAKSKVYVGEFAAHDRDKKPTLRSALAEAAYMMQLERNGDVVRLASYAPLLGKRGHTQWNPDLIYFDNVKIRPTINYYVQAMFGANSGDAWLTGYAEGDVATSCVRDSKSGDVILKVVNMGEEARAVAFEPKGADTLAATAECTVLKGSPDDVNEFDDAAPVEPKTSAIGVGPSIEYLAPGYSLTVIRMHPR